MTPGVVRWFDGQQWTTRTAPTPATPTPVAPTPATSAGTTWTPQAMPDGAPVIPSYGAARATAPQPSRSPGLAPPDGGGHDRSAAPTPGYGAGAAGAGFDPGAYAPSTDYDPGSYAPRAASAPGLPGAGAAPNGPEMGYSRTGYTQNAYTQIGLGDAGRSERRTAIGTLVAGLAVLVAAALSLRFASGQGGIIWTGGFVVGAGLLIRAAVAGRAAREKGSPGLGALAWTGAGVVVLLCAGLVVTSLTTIFRPAPPTEPRAGSCFLDHGAEVELVWCDDRHDLVALEIATTISGCPFATTGYVEDAGLTVCLGTDTGTSGP